MSPLFPKDLLRRNASADLLKVFAIFSVVYIHGSSLIPVTMSTFDFSSMTMSFIAHVFRFCVPVFIFLWAYFSEKSIIKSGKDTSIKRIYKLFLPFVFWSLVYFLYLGNFKELNVSSAITKHWVGYGWSGQYYFIILFQLILLFGIVRKLTLFLLNYATIIILVSVVFYAVISYSSWFEIGVVGKLSYRPFVYWLPYTVLGIIHAHKNIFKFKLPIAFALISPILILIEIYSFHPILTNEYMLPSVFISTILLVSLLQSKLTYENFPAWISGSVLTIANSTLGIFCLNPLVILIVSPLLRQVNHSLKGPGFSLLMPIISTILILAFCILIIKVIKKLKLGLLVSN